MPGRPEDYYDYIDWLQSKKDSTDIYENKRYAVAKKDTDELIGMVGMGLEDTLNEVEVAYFMSAAPTGAEAIPDRRSPRLRNGASNVSDVPYLILTVDCANAPSCLLAGKCGFELFEKRTPIGHVQPNMESDSYYYYRLYRKQQ
jgi:RimJ/RimL family protein N-acetyltransferase